MLKSGNKAELLKAIDTILRGDIYVTEGLNSILHKTSGIHAQFTKREKVIINMIKLNKTNQQIAEALYISIRTVENHISNIYFKTGAENRQDLMAL